MLGSFLPLDKGRLDVSLFPVFVLNEAKRLLTVALYLLDRYERGISLLISRNYPRAEVQVRG